ncbi:DUF6708 domain-containing protein (plasmid) [Ralstonia sp. 25C]|uniref:DUF6708 domain-containing protein n=1 Tax=Ralstonia sp. 25C TaxID=3447363 RepID=UPI003F74F117
MADKKSKLHPQNRNWHEDLPSPTTALKTGDKNDQPDPGLDVRYVDANVLELSRAASIERGLIFLFSVGTSIGYVYMLPFLFEMLTDRRVIGDSIFSSEFLGWVFLIVMQFVLVVILIYGIKKSVRTTLDLPVLLDRKSQKIFALEYLMKTNPFARWEAVIKEFEWSRVEAEIGTLPYKPAPYGLILAQCERGTTKVEDRIILKQVLGGTAELHQMWAYIRCYMNEGPEHLPKVKPFPRDANFWRCLFAFFPFLDPTEGGRRARARMGRCELHVSVAFASVVMLALVWYFVPIGICEYIAQRLAPKPKWPDDVLNQTGLRSSMPDSLG